MCVGRGKSPHFTDALCPHSAIVSPSSSWQLFPVGARKMTMMSGWWCFARSVSWLRWVSSASFPPQRLQKQPWLRLAPQSPYESGSCFWLSPRHCQGCCDRKCPLGSHLLTILPGRDGESLLLQLTVGPRTSQRDVHVMPTVAFAGGETFLFSTVFTT